MPILSVGRYSIRTTSERAGGFVRGEVLTFTYVPWWLAVWGAVGAVFGVLVRVWRRVDRAFPAWKFLVLIPGIVAIAVPIAFDNYEVAPVSPPLGTLTASFLLWRVLRIRSWLPGVVLALAAGVAAAAAAMLAFFVQWDYVPAKELLVGSFVIGGIVTLPVGAVRIAVRKGATWRRLLAAGALSGVVSLMIVSYLGAHYLDLGQAAIFFGAWFILPFLLLAGLVKWNRWARAVATGAMFKGHPDAGQSLQPRSPHRQPG